MAVEIKVPDLGESIVEATIAEWLKKEGDRVKVGEPVVVLETEKVDLEVGATQNGVISKITRQQGEDVRVGDVIGMIEEVAETASPTPPVQAPTPPVTSESEAEKVTPVARRLAEEHGVDVGQIKPSDPRGRVTKEDVQRYLDKRENGTEARPAVTEKPAPAQPAAPVPSTANGRREERIRLSRRRRTIAERLVEAQRTAAMLTTFNEIDMTTMMDVRTRHKAKFQERYGTGLGITTFFVKAAIGALKFIPQVNAELDGSDIVIKHYYDIGIAVGAEEGLVVPVLRDADRMSFADIEKAITDFAQRANAGTLTLEDLRGGTFTITNGGVFGSLLSTPILNPPQVGILGLHKIEQRPIALNGEVVIRPMMYVALSYDHRLIDGREAVQFLVRVKELIEDPERLLLEG
jgi:2-oxoglutarate dehydrogenase E2 component (dihydrolipoamide succinyltransferase)